MPSSSGSFIGVTPSGSAEATELKTKLVWLTAFRTVATTLLLAVVALRLVSGRSLEEPSTTDYLSFGVLAAVYASTLVYGLLLRNRELGRGAAHAQVAGDILLASWLVYVTGGADSPFTFAYSLSVIAASILLYQSGALIAAALSSASYALLVVLIDGDLLQSPMDAMPLSSSQLAFKIVSNTLSQFLIAVLSSFLSRQVRAAGGRLVEREEDLKRLGDLQRQILECMPSGLISCDPFGNVEFINRAGTQLLGVSADYAGPLEQLVPGTQRLGGEVRRAELEVSTPQGPRTLGLAITALRNHAGGRLVVFQDLTQLRTAEKELKRADHLAALGRLSAQLAHEVRNPLAAMRGAAQLLANEEQRDPASSRLARILIRESDRLAALVEDFLKFARPPPPALRSADLRQLLVETVDMLRTDPLARGIELRTGALAELHAEVDPDQLRQVLINLLRNALAAVAGRGTVEARLSRVGDEARLHVWDSAGSIPPNDLDRIFDPFFTTREGGTGLGLSTAHSIVRAHRGVIRVASSPARGTEFEIALPLTDRGESIAGPGR